MSVAEIVMNELHEELEAVDLVDELNDFMADLLSERQNEAFLRALFWGKPGIWSSVSTLCTDLEEMKHRLSLLEEEAGDSLVATWLEYPDPANSEGFCLIIFFAPLMMWRSTAIYNQALLLRNSRRNGSHK